MRHFPKDQAGQAHSFEELIRLETCLKDTNQNNGHYESYLRRENLGVQDVGI